jgi:NAD(P)-dependent dehydrogenase (short-subunit alcohol dehydrogenase family)
MKDKIVVITGGAGQVGQTAARRFAELGARVFIIVRRDLDNANKIISSLSNSHLKHEAILASITDTESLKSAVNKITAEAGRCDLLINAAGITKGIHPRDFEKYTDEIVDEILINNIRGPFATIREFAPLLRNSQQALVINISSTAGKRASHSNIMYGASKIALELVTATMSRVLAPTIRVISVCPGILENPTSGAHKPEGTNERMAQEIPLKRVGKAEDVVATIEALATTLTYINGTTILVDGGRLA